MARWKEINGEQHWVGDEDGEYNADLNAVWIADENNPIGGYWEFGGNQTPVPDRLTAVKQEMMEIAERIGPPMGGGGMRIVGSTGRGLGSRILSAIGRWFGRGARTGVLTGSLNGLTAAERSMVQELLAQGKNVQIIPRATGTTADFIIDGVVTELKTLQSAGTNTLKNAIQKASKQGQNILVDARNVPISRTEAMQQILRAEGNIKGLRGRVTVLTNDGPVTY